MYNIYQIGITLLFFLFLPLLPVVMMLRRKNREGLLQRFGFCLGELSENKGAKRVWVHASSVGEVQAARALIHKLKEMRPEVDIVLSTMTPHGQRVAREQLPDWVTCIMAPLDVPFMVKRTINTVQPDVYVCLETELWPSILRALKKKGVPVLMMNGRMSVRSVVTYSYVKNFFKEVLDNFEMMTFITLADMERYLSLGAVKEKCLVAGNVKYDLPLPKNSEEVASGFRSLLDLKEDSEVFVSGSTHTGEEEQLISVYKRFSKNKNFIWLTAPRHLERLTNLEKVFSEQNISYDRFTELKAGKKREHDVVIIDVMGELSKLYSIATYVFCGGSFVERGGHNIMEAAIWDKCVFFGPSMYDYKDAVALMDSARAGFLVKDADELSAKIWFYQQNQAEYEAACRRAGVIGQAQEGAAEKQAGYILDRLE